jgi:hypothetical protein
MSLERVARLRRPPTGPRLSFVIYEKKTGSILGVHQILTYDAPRSNAIVTKEKQRAAAKALHESVLKRTASVSGIPTKRLGVLQVRHLNTDDLAQSHVDEKRGRVVRVSAPVTGARLSTLNALRRVKTR